MINIFKPLTIKDDQFYNYPIPLQLYTNPIHLSPKHSPDALPTPKDQIPPCPTGGV